MIKLNNIFFTYNSSDVIRNLSCEIKEKERVVLLGANGSGKSTLLKIIDGLLFPKKGEYFYKGEQIKKERLRNKEFNLSFRKNVVLLFQNPDTMLFNPTVYDEIAFGLRQLSSDSIDEKVKYWADRLNLSKFLEQTPFELSGGEKQKVCIASLLAIEPELLLLDEPMANLDPRTAGFMIDFLNELNLTTVVTTHNLSMAMELGERAIVLSEEHQLIYDGGLENLRNDREMLIKANLIHIHKHSHKEISHLHYHAHD